MSRVIILVLSLLCTISSNAQPSLHEDLQENIKRRVANGLNQGMVIGLVDSDGVKYYTYGVKSLQTEDPVSEETVFEIGSISKVFTAILLANEIKKGSLNLDDPIDLYLPKNVKSPKFEGEPIRLIHLSNHTSGLPRLPDNFAPADPANPYADYTEAQLYEFLSDYELTRKPGSEYEYSNLGAGLLGHLLALKNEMSYEELMTQVITKPFKMKDSKITLNAKMEIKLAKGHNMGYEVKNWDLPTLAGAGAIRSTAADLMRFLQVNMGLKKSNLYETLQLTHENTRVASAQPMLGLGWHKAGDNNEIIWHNGGTGGYRSFIAFDENQKKGVVILTNSSESADDIGFRILNPNSAIKIIKPSIATKVRGAMDDKGIDAGIKIYNELKKNETDTYEFGEYELQRLGNSYQEKKAFEKAIAVLKLNIELYPKSSFSYSNLGEAYFRSNNKEAAIENFKKALTLSPANMHASVKLEELGIDPESIVEKVVIDVEVLESYTGEYQLAPGFILTVTREEGQLSAQATGQPQFLIFPKSENVFYLKVVEAQLTFNKGDDGMVESVTLLQGGREVPGKKL